MMLKRKNRRFCIMAAGKKGSGKSLFFNSFFDNDIVPLENSSDINMFLLNVDCEGVSQKVSLVDTPGFGFSLKDNELQQNLVDFIKNQFEVFIEEETKIRRDPTFEDPRVHCLLYFIPCTGNGLTQNDISFLKKVHNLVNVVPLLSKSDILDPEEKSVLKEKIQKQIHENEIQIFNFENPDYVEKLEENQNLNSLVPFTIISADESNIKSRIRNYAHGTVEIDNTNHSEFTILKEILLGTHLDVLIDYTASELYENYRTKILENKLEQM